ncbi:MAG TPA: hypothetical protein VNN80_19150 [Polyangiaceae bacterium]|nr:hypothetical protein [Polyangiaceae bacterium]HWP06536.1 hypothetical protein [Polyangiaceae bacterium]
MNESELGRFGQWLDEHRATVKVVAVVDKMRLPGNPSDALAPVFSTTWRGGIIQERAGSVALFDVSQPTPWVGFGFPTIEGGLSATAFGGRETDNPEYIPEPGALEELKGLALIAGAIALGAVLFSRAMR